MMSTRKFQASGFTLIEALVALLVSAIGILGMLALQSRAQQSQLEAVQRVQAIALMEEIVNRMRANPDARRCFGITDVAGAGWLGQTDGLAPGCVGWGSAVNRASEPG